MTEADFPLLSLIITIPLLGALLAGSIRNVDVAKQIAFFTALITFVLTACAALLFDADKSGFQLVERYVMGRNNTEIPSTPTRYSIFNRGIQS